jgi:hypothetical protein
VNDTKSKKPCDKYRNFAPDKKYHNAERVKTEWASSPEFPAKLPQAIYSALHGKCLTAAPKRNRDPGRGIRHDGQRNAGHGRSPRAPLRTTSGSLFSARSFWLTVVLAVIVLVLCQHNRNGAAEPTPTPTASVDLTPTPTPSRRRRRNPRPAVTSVANTYGGELKTEFSARVGSETPLKGHHLSARRRWPPWRLERSSDENVCTSVGTASVTALGSAGVPYMPSSVR